MMRSIRFFILLFLVSAKAHSGETYGILLSGGYNLQNNSYAYYDGIKEMYSGLRKAGIKRDHITTLYADGGEGGVDTVKRNPWTLYFTQSEIDTPSSLEGDGKRDIKYPATQMGISATFDDLSKKMKAGDHLVFFATDHGSQYKGLVLWNGQYYSVNDLRSQLAKLPDGVTTHIAVSVCYGGQFLQLTSKNVCVVTNTDEKTTTNAKQNDDPFVTYLGKGIGGEAKPKNSKSGVRFMDAFQMAKENDLPSNKIHLTSIDYFVEKQDISPPISQTTTCDNRQSPITSIQKEITEISAYLSKVTDPRRGFYEKYLKQKLKDTASSLDTYKLQYSQWVRSGYQEDLDKLKSQWASLSIADKQRLRPYYTGLAEKLRAEDESQRKKINDLESDQKRALAEMRFLKYASPAQLEQYYNIRRCLEHEI